LPPSSRNSLRREIVNNQVMPGCRALGLLALLAALLANACGAPGENPDHRGSSAGTRPAPDDPESGARAPLPPVADVSAPRVVILGDSLTAGLGLSMKDAYPTVLQDRINEEGLKYTMVNAGVSGDTSAGGLSRLDWALDGDVRVLVVALGGNDGLRGLPIAELTRNLSTIIERAQARGITVVLAGMEAPPNYGFDYTMGFHKVYPALARKYHVALVPFLLEGVGGIPALNQPDGIHPTAQGARMVAENVWTALKPALESDSRRLDQRRASSR
jgi:acyl-CoA thioesterase-1